MGWPWGRGKSHLGADVATLGPQLVDLGLGDVGALLRLVQLVLRLAELGQVGVGLFLLGAGGWRGQGGRQWGWPPSICPSVPPATCPAVLPAVQLSISLCFLVFPLWHHLAKHPAFQQLLIQSTIQLAIYSTFQPSVYPATHPSF